MARFLIMEHEGLKHYVYKCPAGKHTIGYGRNVDVAGGIGITQLEAETLLNHDIERITQSLYQKVPNFVALDRTRQAVLIDMCYNLGLTRLRTFKKMFKALKCLDYESAAVEMLNSKWARQVKGRALKLSKLMQTGDYNSDTSSG